MHTKNMNKKLKNLIIRLAAHSNTYVKNLYSGIHSDSPDKVLDEAVDGKQGAIIEIKFRLETRQ